MGSALPAATFRTCITSFLRHTRLAVPPAAGQDVIVLMDSRWQEVLSPPKPTKALQAGISYFPVFKPFHPGGLTDVEQVLDHNTALCGLVIPSMLSYGLIMGELQMLSASLSLCCPHFQLFRQLWMNQKTKHKREKIILENPFLDLVNAPRDCRNIQVQSNRKVWKFYFKGLYYPHLEQIV